jgi:hypothetical protein
MSCLSLAFWENLAIDVVILIAVVALLRLLIMALGGGGPIWPPVTNPMGPGAPSASGLLGFIAAALNIVIWAAILIFIIYVIFALLSCLLGAGGFGFRPLR